MKNVAVAFKDVIFFLFSELIEHDLKFGFALWIELGKEHFMCTDDCANRVVMCKYDIKGIHLHAA